MGANLGDRLATLRRAAGDLAGARFSSLWETEPRGPVADQPWFLNACALFFTDEEPRAVLRRLLTLEARLGRVRDVPQGPRAIDLDLLLHGDRLVDEPGLKVPHPRMTQRAFVLAPLTELLGEHFELRGRPLSAWLADVADQPIRRSDLQLFPPP
jgi:2-amino-4-hydroxy-6-hydroxymethyldihydropteridine diphosphokinase